MRKKICFLFLIMLSVLSLQLMTASGSDALKTYHEGNIAYQKNEFPESITLYESLLKEGYRSSYVYYNLGNAYFKNGSFSKAILNYERALKLDPEDEDTNFNLRIASLKVVDKIESVPDIFYKKWMNAISMALSSSNWTILLIIITWLLFAAAAVYIVGKSVSVKKAGFVSMIALVVVTIFTAILTSKSHSITYVDEKAIVMSPSVYVKSSPDEKGNDLFILHEGTKVDLLDRFENWNKIRIANGSIGWMKTGDMEKI